MFIVEPCLQTSLDQYQAILALAEAVKEEFDRQKQIKILLNKLDKTRTIIVHRSEKKKREGMWGKVREREEGEGDLKTMWFYQIHWIKKNDRPQTKRVLEWALAPEN